MAMFPWLNMISSGMDLFKGGLKTVGKSVAGGVGGAIGQAAGGAANKVMGIPEAPGGKTGAALGQDMSAMMDKAYPGTNPWERLGAPGYSGAAVEAQKQSGKQARSLQQRDLASKERIAQVQAQAHVQGQAMSIGPQAVRSALKTQYGGQGGEYKTQAQAHVKLLNEQKRNEIQKTIISGNEAKIKAAQASVAKLIAKYSVTAEKNKTLLAAVENALREKDPMSATSIGVAKAGGIILGATAIGKFMRGVRFLLPTFGKTKLKFTKARKSVEKRPQMNPQKPTRKAPKRPPLGKLSKAAIKAMR